MILARKTKKLQSGGVASYGNKPIWQQMNQAYSSQMNPAAFQNDSWMSQFNHTDGLQNQMEAIDTPPPSMVSTDATTNASPDSGFTLEQNKDKTGLGEKLFSTGVGMINQGAGAMGKQGFETKGQGLTETPQQSMTQPNSTKSFIDAGKEQTYSGTIQNNFDNMSLAGNKAASNAGVSMADGISLQGNGGIAQQAMGTGSTAAASGVSGLAGTLGGGASSANTLGSAAVTGGGGAVKGAAGSAAGAGGGAGVGMAAQAAGQIGVGLIDHFQNRKIDQYGVEKVNSGAEVGKGALKGAATGASIGSVVPGIGTAVGAVAGAVIGTVGGFIGARKKRREARKLREKVKHVRRQGSISEDVANSQAIGFGKSGMRLRVNSFFDSLPPATPEMLKSGGKLQSGGKVEQSYVTELSPEETVKFDNWFGRISKHKNLNTDPDVGDYDYRGYWKDPEMKAESMLEAESKTHFLDKYKQPNHTTFSDESIYFNDGTKDQAGSWQQKGEDWMYVPYNNSVKDTLIDRRGELLRLKNGELQKFQDGGKMNVIPKGKLHKENNNLGNGDKGIPVVSSDGTKTFELEKEELILHLAATQKAEELVAKYKETNDEAVLEELGMFITDEIVNNTEDKSGTILKKGGKK